MVLVAGFVALRMLKRGETGPVVEPPTPRAAHDGGAGTDAATAIEPDSEGADTATASSATFQADERAGGQTDKRTDGQTGKPAGEPSTNTAALTKEKPPKHFSRPTEELLAMMLSTPPEIEMPPLPALDPNDARLNADAILALTNDLVIYETDDERLVELKEAVAAVKEQLAEAVKSGGNVADVLNEFRNWQNEGAKVRGETIKAINAIEDDAEAAKALDDANKTFQEDGVVPIRPEEVGFDTGDDNGEE